MTDLTASALADALRDRYVLERELGRGGMATVYLAHDTKHDRKVALKVLHAQLGTVVGLERFHREIRLAARLQHPHILPVHDSGETAGHLWYTMPFVDGESVRDRLRRERQLPISDALQITREVADALGYAHSEGVVHRDIKPENILLSHSHALVADFGVARALTSAGTEGLTEAGVSVGTPAYMSPEQSLADPVLDGRSDLYSLGCVLYEMLAGEAPYTGTSAQAIVAKRLREPIPHVRTVRETVPPSVDRALERVLAKTAADRYPTAASFAADLVQEPSAAATGTRSTVPESPPRRPRLPLALVLALLVAVVAGAFLRTLRRPATDPNTSADHPIRLAVMAFENQGAPADEYFADGLSDEVRGKLSSLPSLRVTARSSSTEYKATHKSPRDIAQELGVQYLLSGTVRWDKRGGDARVRVSPELILAADASTVWQAPFDAPLNDVFRVQTQIAEQVAQALNLVLRTGDQAALATRPTQNLLAYDAFLRGEEISGSLSRTDANTLKEATTYYQQAVDLDSTFVAAWLQLTRAHANAFMNGYDPSPKRREATRQAFERVGALRPDGYERHWAGSIYYGAVLNDRIRGEKENQAALRLAPRHPDLLRNQGTYEMNAGQWDSALVHLHRAAEVDPRSVNTLSTEAFALMLLRRYPAATEVTQQTLVLDSTNLESWKTVAMAHVAEGDLAAAKATSRAAATRLGSIPVAAYFSTYTMSWLLDPSLQQVILPLRPADYGDDTTSWGSALWSTLLLMGDTARARIYSDSARLVQERLVAEDSTNFDQRQHLARMLAVAGLADRAKREIERAVTEAEAAGNPTDIAYMHDRVARTLLLLGRKDEAMGHLTAALAGPFVVTRAWAKLDPDFRSLRGDVRFERLLNGQ